MKASVLQVIFYTWAAASLSFSCHSYFPKSSGHIPVFLLRCQYHNAHISKAKRPASHAISDEVWVRGQDFVCCIIWDSQQKVGNVHHNAHAHRTKLEIPGNQLKIPPTWDFIHGSFFAYSSKPVSYPGLPGSLSLLTKSSLPVYPVSVMICSFPLMK